MSEEERKAARLAANRKYAKSAKGIAQRKLNDSKRTPAERTARYKRVKATRDRYRATSHGQKIIKASQMAHFNSLYGRVGSVLSDIKGRCKRKGLEFDLDREWLTTRFEGTCELTGMPFVVKVYVQGQGPKTGNNFAASVDRIDPNLGYLKSNCRVVLMCVNAFKRTMSDEDMFVVAKALLSQGDSNKNNS